MGWNQNGCFGNEKSILRLKDPDGTVCLRMGRYTSRYVLMFFIRFIFLDIFRAVHYTHSPDSHSTSRICKNNLTAIVPEPDVQISHAESSLNICTWTKVKIFRADLFAWVIVKAHTDQTPIPKIMHGFMSPLSHLIVFEHDPDSFHSGSGTGSVDAAAPHHMHHRTAYCVLSRHDKKTDDKSKSHESYFIFSPWCVHDMEWFRSDAVWQNYSERERERIFTPLWLCKKMRGN